MLAAKFVDATHIVGGEIYYEKLGGNNYKIHLKVYRDCLNGIPPFDNPAVISIFDVNGNLVTSLSVPLTSSITVPPTNNSPCAPVTAGNACVEEAIYETIVNLPPLVGGYTLAYQRCCRNGTILNLVNPGNVGATYWEHIPGPEVITANNSPHFTNRPPIYICANIPISFDHVATDPDGDSLVYSLCDPFNGLDPCCPIIPSAQGACAPGCPIGSSTFPPPYTPVPFLLPYSSSFPMASNPAININPVTGFLNGNPTTLGQWVVGVCVSEYRNGVLIGTHHRDFQFNVINCPFVVHAGITSQTTSNNGLGTGYCNGNTVSYSNNSSGNSSTFHWDFGDLSTTADTSNLFNPTYTFQTPGDYTVTLIANPGTPCADTTHDVFHIHPLLAPSFLNPSNQCLNGNNYNFVAAGSYQGNGTFSWNFGNSAVPLTASTVSVSNVHYTTPGVKTVSLTVAENGCTATVTQTLEVAQNPIATIGNYITSGCAPLTFTLQNQSTTGPYITYLWTFSNGTTSQSITPTVTFTNAGVYSFTLSAISNQVCIDTTSMASVSSITVTPLPIAQFSTTPSTSQCFNGNNFNFSNTSTVAGNSPSYSWNFGNAAIPAASNAVSVNNVNYSSVGIKTVSLSVNDNGCLSSITKTIEIAQNPIANIGNYIHGGCAPLTVTIQNTSTTGPYITYLWTFSNGTTSQSITPTITFTNPGVYTFTLSAMSNQVCIDTTSMISVSSITAMAVPLAQFNVTPDTVQCFNGHTFNFNNTSTLFGNSPTYQWNFGANATPVNATTLNVANVIYSSAGIYPVTLTVTENGCSNTATLSVALYSNPVALIGPYPLTGCNPQTITLTSVSTSASPLTYLWSFSDGTTSNVANPTHVFTPVGVYSFSLTVFTNSLCVNTSSIQAVSSVTIHPSPIAGFEIISDNMSEVKCIDTSSPDVIAWNYNFDDGYYSQLQNPIHFYHTVNIFNIKQTVTNEYGCRAYFDTDVLIIPDFGFWIPNAFTPGKKDGLNDVFKPVVHGVEKYEFMIFDRWGEQIYLTTDIAEGWDGTYKDRDCQSDVYVWKCNFRNLVSKQTENHVGHVTLLR